MTGGEHSRRSPNDQGADFRGGFTRLRSCRSLLLWSGRPGGPIVISNMQAMVAIQMRIGMAHPVVIRLVPNGPALTLEIVMEMNRSILRRLSRTPHPGLTSAYLSLSATSILLMRRRKLAKSDESTAGRERTCLAGPISLQSSLHRPGNACRHAM